MNDIVEFSTKSRTRFPEMEGAVDKHRCIRRHSPGGLSESTEPPSISMWVHGRLTRGEALVVVVALSLGFWRVILEAISFAIRTPRAIREKLRPEPVYEPLSPRPEVSEPPSKGQYKNDEKPDREWRARTVNPVPRSARSRWLANVR
jgi:hypothetical protein